MKHSLESDIIGMVLLLFFLLSLKAETARNSFMIAVRPVCNVMPENITDIVLKVILAILSLHRVRLNTPVLICFRKIRLFGSPLSVWTLYRACCSMALLDCFFKVSIQPVNNCY